MDLGRASWTPAVLATKKCLMLRSLAYWLPLASVAFSACGGPEASAPLRALPAYESRDAALFDDAIEASAVGLNLEDSAPVRADAVLRERTQTGDAVVRVRVETVTASADSEGTRYQIALRPLATLAGTRAPSGTFTVVVDKRSPAMGIVKSFDARLGGKTFVAFIREFQTGEERRFHFHFAADSKEVNAAVREAVDLQ